MVRLALLAAVTIGIGLAALTGPNQARAVVDYNCSDFSTQAAAQSFFLANGGPSSDPYGLDADHDGIACESNPCPCSSGAPAPAPTPAPAPVTGGGGGGGGHHKHKHHHKQRRKRCGTTPVPTRGVNAKTLIAVGRLPCTSARDLISAAYSAEDTRPADGDGNRGIFWSVNYWRCSIGLGGSQTFCFQNGKEVDGSTRTDDGWFF
jgi:hypothetical protein